jgi:hypothetical protein
MAKTTTTTYSATTINSKNQREMNDTILSCTNDEAKIQEAYDFINNNKSDHKTNLVNVARYLNPYDSIVSTSPYSISSFNMNNIVTTKVKEKVKVTIDSFLADQDLEILGDSKQFTSYKYGVGQDLSHLTVEAFELMATLYAARSTMKADDKYDDSKKEALKLIQDSIFLIDKKLQTKTIKNAGRLTRQLDDIEDEIEQELLMPTTTKISSQISYLKSCMRIKDATSFKRDIASSLIYNEMKNEDNIDAYFELLQTKKTLGL